MANEAHLSTPREVLLSAPTRRRQSLGYVWPIGVSVAIVGGMYASRKYEVSLLDVILSFVLILTTCVLYRRWQENNKRSETWTAAPLLLTLALAFSQTFALGIYWSSRVITDIDRGYRPLEPWACTTAILMSVVALGAIYWGTQLRLADACCVKFIPHLKNQQLTWNYCRVWLAIGVITAHNIALIGSMEGLRQVAFNVMLYVPLAAFCILFRRCLEGVGTTTDKVLLIIFAANQVFAGISSGWLGSALTFMMVSVAVYIGSRNRLPIAALLVMVVYTIFMQPGKERFRNEYWYGGRTGSAIERVAFWVQASTEAWGDVLFNKNESTKVTDLLSTTTDRASLIAFTAQIVEEVPIVIPYQNGKTYGFLLVSWVPRALWPGKPSASEVNHLYQTTFRLTREENLDNVSLAPGIIGEAYWNFGWAGVVIIGMLLGLLIRYMEMQFARRSSGVLLNAIIVGMLPLLLGVEAHMGTYIGGLLLQMIVILAAFAPVSTLRSTSA